jgi:hypothetical protein
VELFRVIITRNMIKTEHILFGVDPDTWITVKSRGEQLRLPLIHRPKILINNNKPTCRVQCIKTPWVSSGITN